MLRANKLVLDVACGNTPRGNVNVDIVIPSNVDEIPNFVLADIRYLPFKDHVFDEVRTSNLFWYQGRIVKPESRGKDYNVDAGEILKELVRVAKNLRTRFRLYSED